jgi:hypothetical protein
MFIVYQYLLYCITYNILLICFYKYISNTDIDYVFHVL